LEISVELRLRLSNSSQKEGAFELIVEVTTPSTIATLGSISN